ncbi:heterokaryon incompatibility protein-domain-containing protein [Mariannaea sp. PMI_226]|nr:heterokaryon incompatibility protein-domain-containing protein [Mariannaea sp. PMI_226]
MEAKDNDGTNLINTPVPVFNFTGATAASPLQPSTGQNIFMGSPVASYASQRPAINVPVPAHNIQTNFITSPVQPMSSQSRVVTRPLPSYMVQNESASSSGPSQNPRKRATSIQELFANAAKSRRTGPGGLNQTGPRPSPMMRIFSGPYVYSTLPHPDSLRILRIEPGTTEKLMLRVETIRLCDTSRPYDALSYVWGREPQYVQVSTPDGTLQVRKNLCDALYCLRLADKPRYVWADAICINQEDTTERGQQVGLMRKIYKRAATVQIWLGKEDMDEAPIAFSIARGVVCNGQCNGLHGPVEGVGTASHQDCPPPPLDSPLWSTIGHLYSNLWFWRVWCIQEVALASSAVVLWGTSQIPWKWLGLAAARIRINNYALMSREDMKGVLNAYFMYRISQGDVTVPPQKLSFLHLLAITRQFGATDPRDRIYGILGLATTDADPDSGDLYIKPDYSIPTDEVYRQLAYKVLETDKSLRLLSCVQHGPEISEKWPSWIPQWGSIYNTALGPFHRAATSSTATRTEFRLISKNVLQVQGFHVSTVREVLPPFPNPNGRLLPPLDMYQQRDVRKALSKPRGPLRFSLTLTAEQSWHGDIIEDYTAHLNDFAELVRKFEPSLASYFEGISGGNPERIFKATRSACTGRRLFIDTDDQLGLAPLATRRGDLVCFLSGGRLPFIVRQEGQFVLLIGECYLYDYLEARADKILIAKELTSRWFKFC